MSIINYGIPRITKHTVTWVDRDLVVGVNHWGYQGPPSNEVMITWGEAKK